MSWFGKGRWRRREVTLSEQVYRYLEGWQRKLADRLNARCIGIGTTQLKCWLVAISLVVAVYLCWVMAGAFG